MNGGRGSQARTSLHSGSLHHRENTGKFIKTDELLRRFFLQALASNNLAPASLQTKTG
jgi:hypothetical protein